MRAAAATALLSAVLVGAVTASDLRHAIVKVIVQVDGAAHGYLITTNRLKRKDSVHLQHPTADGKVGCCKHLLARDFEEAEPGTVLATDEAGGQPVLVYRMRVPRPWYEMPFIGMAVVGQGMTTRPAGQGQGNELEAVDRSGRVRRAGLCTSQEGVHLIEREGRAERTHLYLSVGHEIEAPTCQ
jgi:hypothetical protein